MITKKEIYHNYGYVDYKTLNDIIELLMNNGLDPNIRNNDGKTFLQASDMKDNIEFIDMLPLDKMDLNNQDNDGKTILHNLVDENIDPYFLMGIYEKIENYIDATIKDNNGKTFLDLLDAKTKDYEYPSFLRLIRRSYYTDNFNYFIDKLDNDLDEVNNFLNLLFDDNNFPIIHFWLHSSSAKKVNYKNKLDAIKKLSDLNAINPNIKLMGLLHIVVSNIRADYDKNYVLKLTEICLGKKFDFRDLAAIMKEWLTNYSTVNDFVDMYVLLSKHGYNSLGNDINISKAENKREIYQEIRNEGFVKMLNNFLSEQDLSVMSYCLSDIELLNNIFEIQNLIESSLEIKNDYGMAKLLVEKVVENRKNTINIIEDNIVSLKELNSALRNILEEHMSNVVNPISKILTKID